jgi:predicted Na+-dependent transporter
MVVIDWISLAGNVLLFLLVFNMSATVDISCMKTQLQNTKAICVGLVAQFLILPFLGFVMVWIMQLPYELGIMLLVVTSSPGGSYSNW